ncbi:MAG TPA: YbhB/YbcL family Raf kinase inhibitor-like protein [Gemmatimonadaceae bacterium]|jgi:hypothetical protein
MALELTSKVFKSNGAIPDEHTCDGAEVPPPLEWSGVPAEANSLALIVDDPDAPDPAAPKRTFVHWLVYDIPTAAQAIGGHGRSLPTGAREGTNDAGKVGYAGPCPPAGRHRYFFKLYALDVRLGDLGAPTKAQLEEAMRDHVLEHRELVGTYERAKIGVE